MRYDIQNLMNTPKANFSKIISNQVFGSYYHHFSGFDDCGFIGYYNKGVVSGASAAVYTISYMLNAKWESHL